MTSLTILAVAGGGAVGAVARYGAHRWLTALHGADAAWSTLWINVAGSFALGVAAAMFVSRAGVVPPFVMIGFLGAFTTFSTFAFDAVVLFRDRGLGAAGLYVGLSVALSICAVLAGMLVGKEIS